MKKNKPSITVEEYLQDFPAKIKGVVKVLRAIIKETVPEYTEAVYTGWKLIGYRVINGKKSHYFGFIFPTEDKVVLGFEYGYLMSDPDRILTGKGSQVNQIEIKNKTDINPDKFNQYISEAVMIALSRNDIKG